jgi:hypothetical protein
MGEKKLNEILVGVAGTCDPCVPNAVNIFQVVDFSCDGGRFRHVLFTVVSPNSLRFRCGVLEGERAPSATIWSQQLASFPGIGLSRILPGSNGRHGQVWLSGIEIGQVDAPSDARGDQRLIGLPRRFNQKVVSLDPRCLSPTINALVSHDGAPVSITRE